MRISMESAVNRVERGATGERHSRMSRFALVALLVVALAGCGGGSSGGAAQADYPAYDTLAALHAKADLVVTVDLSTGTEAREFETIDYTVFRGTVRHAYKGSAGDRIEIKQPASEAGGIPLRPGQRYLLFLEVYSGVPASLLNPGQAQYRLDSAGQPTPVDDRGLRFSLADLEALSL
jgi:hypothetical protein